MCLKQILLSLIVLVLFGGCSSSSSKNSVADKAVEETNVESGSGAVKSLAAKDEKICKKEAITGSRFKRKVCATEAEWKRMSEESSRMINNSNVRSMQGNPDGG
ncbi:hypothetical protein [Microbulbifer sp.]|uniref:hypothetical protein n=1 Tax=Microbulbifer sp. TaxID=1908541 RepID=UPI00258E5E65|nr:hypothetical protein [Microbulbifer sp.]